MIVSAALLLTWPAWIVIAALIEARQWRVPRTSPGMPGPWAHVATWIAYAAVFLAPIGLLATDDRIIDRKIDQAFFDLDAFRTAVQRFAQARHHLLDDAEGLGALTAGPEAELARVPRDPWQQPYVYRRTGGTPGFVVYSMGADGVDDRGAGDDVTTRDKSYRCETYDEECAGSRAWWRHVALAVSFLGGAARLIFSALRASAQGAREAAGARLRRRESRGLG